jgi:hypothetical protein
MTLSVSFPDASPSRHGGAKQRSLPDGLANGVKLTRSMRSWSVYGPKALQNAAGPTAADRAPPVDAGGETAVSSGRQDATPKPIAECQALSDLGVHCIASLGRGKAHPRQLRTGHAIPQESPQSDAPQGDRAG